VALLHAASRGGERRAVLVVYRIVLLATLGLLLPTGHLGSTLVRGEDFLTAPLHAHDQPAADGAAAGSAYARVIAPIFASRCTTCHSTAKKKGGLALDDTGSVLVGGVDGPVIVEGKPDESLMLHRLRLPDTDRDHMPPRGKPQPTPEEIRKLEAWIKAGAPFEGEFDVEPAKPVAPADHAALKRATDALAHVEPIAQDSSLLWVDFAPLGSKATDALVADLATPLLEQIEQLSLGQCAIGDDTLALAARMPHLKKLDVRATKVTSAGLAALASAKNLEELNLAQTHLDDAALPHVLAIPKLKRVHLWSSGVSIQSIDQIRAERPALEIGSDEDSGGAVLETEKPLALTGDAPVPGAQALAPVNEKCPVTDKPVDPAYRVVYRGRVVGFCCPKCPPQFWENPEKFASKLP
jgi:YHS domain-containing protein